MRKRLLESTWRQLSDYEVPGSYAWDGPSTTLPEVGFEHIAVNLLQARFGPTSE